MLDFSRIVFCAGAVLVVLSQRVRAVDFEAEILPFLKESCLACHNQTKAKADLVLETPQTILKGGESGPAVVPGKARESLLWKVASRAEKPFMPPKDNKVNAPDLTAKQLALLELWIEEGARGEVRGTQAIVWQTLKDTVRPILSLALTDDAQFSACGRGSQLFLYQLPTGRSVGPLVDPELRGVRAAHLDLVQSLDFSPDGELLASGSYREVKLWRRQHKIARPAPVTEAAYNASEVVTPDGKIRAVAGEDRTIRLLNAADQKVLHELKGDYPANFRVAQVQRALARSTNHVAYRKAMVEKAEKERQAQVERVRKASEAVSSAQKSLTEQTNLVAAAKTEESGVQKELAATLARAKEAQDKAEKAQAELAKIKASFKDPDELIAAAAQAALATNQLAVVKSETEKAEKAVQEKLKAVQKKIADAEAALKRGGLTNSAAENELSFAIAAAQNAADGLTSAQNNLQSAEADRKQHELHLQAAQRALTNSFSLVRALAFSSDGRMLAAASDQATVTWWSTDSGQPLETLACNATNVAFNGETIVTFGADKTEAWDILPGWKLERVIALVNGQPAFADRVNAVRFSPDGQFLATGGGEPSRAGEVKIWRVRDGQPVQEFKGLHSDTVLALAYSPDGRFLASGAADRFAKVTEVASGKVVRVLEGHTHHVLGITWKADGHTLLTGGADNLVKVWDAFSGDKKKGPEPFNKEVTSIAYMGESDQALASAGDATLRIIKEGGEKVRSLEGAAGYVQAALPSPDGRMAVAGGQDGVLRVWQVESGKLLAEFPPR